jgi:hypothetical protein
LVVDIAVELFVEIVFAVVAVADDGTPQPYPT